MMNLLVNGETLSVDPAAVSTVRALIAHLGLDKGPVAVERNGDVVPRAEHDSSALAANDKLEIVHFVGGG